jgi:hypothetical protein
MSDISSVLSLLSPFINSPLVSSTALSKEGAQAMQTVQQIAQQIFGAGQGAPGLGGMLGSADMFKLGQDIPSLTKASSNVLEILNNALLAGKKASSTAVFNKDPLKRDVPTDSFTKLEKDDKTDPPYYIPKKNNDAGSGGSGGGTATA